MCFFYEICYDDEAEDPVEPPVLAPRQPITETDSEPVESRDYGYKVEIYPNPTKSEVAVSVNSSTVTINKVEIYNLLGVAVKQQTVGKSTGTVSTDSMPDGIYVVKVYLSNGEVVVRRLVKQQ